VLHDHVGLHLPDPITPSVRTTQSVCCRLGNALLRFGLSRTVQWPALVCLQVASLVVAQRLSCMPDSYRLAQPLAATQSLLHAPDLDERLSPAERRQLKLQRVPKLLKSYLMTSSTCWVPGQFRHLYWTLRRSVQLFALARRAFYVSPAACRPLVFKVRHLVISRLLRC